MTSAPDAKTVVFVSTNVQAAILEATLELGIKLTCSNRGLIRITEKRSGSVTSNLAVLEKTFNEAKGNRIIPSN